MRKNRKDAAWYGLSDEEVIRLYFSGRFSHSELGASYGVSSSVVAGRYYRLRQKGLLKDPGRSCREHICKGKPGPVYVLARREILPPEFDPPLPARQGEGEKPTAEPKTLLALQSDECAYPEGFQDGMHTFCGAPAVRGRHQMCAYHQSLMYESGEHVA